MAAKKLSAALKSLIRQNSLETLRDAPRDIGKGVFKAVVSDVIGGGVTDTGVQLLGLKDHSHEPLSKNGRSEKKEKGLKKGEEVTLFDAKQEKKKTNPDIAPGLDYRYELIRGSERKRKADVQQLSSKYDQIVDELKRIAASSKILQERVKFVATEQAPSEIGTYHYNFVEWLLLMIRQARQKVEDSGAWLNIAKKKRGLIQDSWNKGNTSVTMSNERMVATQTG